MSGNPFVEGDGHWQVVVNGDGRHALWRPFLDLPAGWRVVANSADREAALDYVQLNWRMPGPAAPAAPAEPDTGTERR
ncbi:MbtH family NRPS accessory protein [Streptomyces phaeolivaceus]|uniref:MbtH family NRPS accessory protein n=1 Tax=Streptomyces phaeolivaceus TaxID=2653200 RepID=A0A5P8KAU7_9ACTN|nr:MbtH family NRPS accessory protein [Streptomyces phaeolivaceus]QFR00444.1 MbtH family NRPS accessory protein [Streptomyces phaeolivaceus]